MKNSGSIIISFDIPNKSAAILPLDAIESALKDTGKILWIHCDLHDKEFTQKALHLMHMPDDVKSMLNDSSTIPKVDETEDSLTLKIQAPLELEPDKKHHLDFTTLIIHLTSHYCLTISAKPIPALLEFIINHEKSLRYARTPCFILFILIDNILNDYGKVLYTFETQTDQMDFLIRSTHKHDYRHVMNAKRGMIKTKRYTSSIRDILLRISGRKINVISEQCRKSLQDAYAHAQAIVTETDSVREILNGILDQIDNNLMHKMSETMTVLTAYATIFMPPTLIASLYGMNFVNMPELHWEYGYYYALSLMLGSALFLYYMFKRRKWF